MIDLKAHMNALKISWIRRIKNNGQTNKLFYSFVPNSVEFCLNNGCSYFPFNTSSITNIF
jgi:hypothetical protein